MRARDWRTKGLHLPACTARRPPSRSRRAWPRSKAAPNACWCRAGFAAISLVSFALLKTGDEVLIPDNAYGPNKALATGELANFGITHRLYDAMNPADLAAKLSRPHPPGVGGGRGLGHDGVSDLPALVASAARTAW